MRKTVKLTARRKSALKRLEAQLSSGVKPAVIDNALANIPLEEKDLKRIEKEIQILKSRI